MRRLATAVLSVNTTGSMVKLLVTLQGDMFDAKGAGYVASIDLQMRSEQVYIKIPPPSPECLAEDPT